MLLVGFDLKNDKFTLKINSAPHEKLKKDEEEKKEMCKYKSVPLISNKFIEHWFYMFYGSKLVLVYVQLNKTNGRFLIIYDGEKITKPKITLKETQGECGTLILNNGLSVCPCQHQATRSTSQKNSGTSRLN